MVRARLPSGQHHCTPCTNLHCTARGRPTSSAGCFAVRPVPAGSSAAVASRPVPAVFACYGLVLQAVFACSPLPAIPAALNSAFALFCFDFPAPCSLPCAPGSSCKLQGLPCWQLQHGPAVAARAPVLTFTFFLQSPLILGHG